MANESTKDLRSGRTEALQALRNALGHAMIGDRSSASHDQLKALSNQLGEILDDGSLQQNEQGQFLNDDGDPIVEIAEPAFETSEASVDFDEPDLVPIHSLSPAERERRRLERDRILDILEEEERLLQFKEHEEEEKQKEIIRRRMEEAKLESERLLRANALHRKGKALLGDVGKDKESQSLQDSTTQKHSKKNVTFSEPVILGPTTSASQEVTSSEIDWGDIAVGRLRSSPRVPIVSTASADKYPMKVRVVERGRPNATIPTSNNADSDDEFPIPLSPSQRSEGLGDDEDHTVSEEDADSKEDETSAEFSFEDFDSAQHQREVALEYLAKRHAVGQEVAQAMETYHSSGDESEYPSSRTQEPTVTRFRADRMASTYGRSCPQEQPCTSLGSSIILEARQKSIQNAIRFGKLQNERLLGGPSGESGSDDDETREITELLKSGNVQNVGPDFGPAMLPSHHSSQDPLRSAVAANEPSSTSQGDTGTVHQQTIPSAPVSSRVIERTPQRLLSSHVPRDVQDKHVSSRRPDQPPVVVPSAMKYSALPTPPLRDSTDGRKKMMSRFMAEKQGQVGGPFGSNIS